MRRNSGFTLIEMLITMVILAVIMSVLMIMLSSTSRTYKTNEDLSQQQEASEAAQQLLTYELALAGYKGTDGVARTFSSPGNTLVVTKGAAANQPDTVAVRYFEDRFTTTATERYVVFSLDKTAKTLTRTENGGTAAVMADKVTNFKVIQYITRTGTKIEATPGTPVPNNLAALNLELEFEPGRVWRFPVGLNNAQQAVAN